MDKGIIFNGPSLLDGSPIIVIGTYSDRNTKTGRVLQTYILHRDMHPAEASKTGADVAICGNCNLRGHPTDDPKAKQAKGRRCYVNLAHGPNSVWKAAQRGTYPDLRQDRAALGRGRMVRVGTYGDPAACPDHVWEQLLSEASGWTAYSHQSGWRPDIAMQSVDSYAQAWSHWRHGRRTFRVLTGTDRIDPAHEVVCPASKEAGRRVQCADCKLCAGGKLAKSIAIIEH